MAFLDNSGDIILDTVLTEIGRKRMATGNFKITKFALGDDEIDYSLYDKTHASGSAYYDLEILQTPVFQATTGINANINYGLLSYANTNLLYLPTMKRNENLQNSCQNRGGIYYLAVNDGGVTSTALIAGFGGVSGGGTRQLLQSGQNNGSVIALETGLDTDELKGTTENQQAYIVSQGLMDSGFQVSVDNRFIRAVMGPSNTAVFNNGGTGGKGNVATQVRSVPPGGSNPTMANQSISTIKAVSNKVYYRVADTTADTSISVIAGPRAAATFINFETTTLAASDFSRYGKTGQSISGASGTYKFIDTTVTVIGSGGSMDQLPIRIIQKE